MKHTVSIKSLRRTLFAVLLMFIAVAGLNAQNGPCNNPPNCIVNNEVGTTPAGNGGDMNSTPALTVNGWYASHGTPTMFGNDCPTSSNNNSIWMWSYSGRGEGVYTCYNFQAQQVYTVCLWVRNTNGILNGGNLRVLAANGLTNTVYPVGTGVPAPASSQLIANSWGNNGVWTQVSYTFTANANYAELWIYPYMLNGPVNNQQYELQIDDIRVTPGSGQPVNLSISASPPVIDWCQSSTLSIGGAPVGTTVSWAPSTGLSSTTGLSVSANPCATTTYTATVTVPGGNPNCPSCFANGGTYTLVQTVVVNQPSFSIIGNPNIKCGEMLELRVIPGFFCPEVSYTWSGPNGFSATGPNIIIGPADATYAGTYTVVITHANGCSYTVTVNVTVDCPCEAKPDFHWDGCNPVTFYGVNTGGSTVITYFWEFGDGQTSTLQNPVHNYAVGGAYKVCLTILTTNGAGQTCCERICHEVQVCPPGHCQATANFSAAPNFHHYTVAFTDLSTGTGVACAWDWDFGDGNLLSGVQNPFHSYASPGFYYVCLHVTFCIYDAQGVLIDKCDATYCQWVIVDQQIALRQAGSGLPAGDDMVKVFPNPASTELFIAAKEDLQPTVRVMNVAGQEVSNATLAAKNQYRVDVSLLAPGLYMVEVMYPDGTTKHVQFVKE